ncbi:uncharacterized protein [Amphiura filiformis]|uniref:uncharacterized protein isoform X2 n=1 Tax=Amphiura filiformis TaxID=82378 RepID=UPI003B21731D
MTKQDYPQCWSQNTPASPHASRRSQSQASLVSAGSQDHIHTRPGGKKTGIFKRFSRQRSTTTEPPPLRPKSECTNLSFDKELTRSDELLDLMYAQGKISRDDRADLLNKFATAANYKTGDAQRMILGNLVKTGKISIDDAVHYSRLLGIVASAETEAKTIAEVSNAFQDKRVYNFGVYKYYKHRTCQRRILQIDFQSCQICNIQKGNLNRKFSFVQVTDYESEEGLRFFIYFKDHQEYELEADSLEEKEKICRLLNLIVEQNKSTAKGRVLTQADFQGALTRCQAVIKEGFLEKKNHNLYTTWTRRWVRIRQGELSYYKPDDDNQQALNILQLSDDVTIIKKLNFNSFSIETRKKVYYFRIITANNLTQAEAEKHRDEWFKAIRFASGDRRQSVAHLGDDVFNKNTVLGTVPPQPPKMDRESVHMAIRGFYEELEVLGSVVGGIDAKGDCQKTMGKLQCLAKQLESFLNEQRSESEGSRPDSSCANSTSMDTESTSQADTNRQSILENGHASDQSFDESLRRHSLIFRNSWARLDNGNALANLANSNDPSKTNLEENGNKENIVNTTPPQRTSLILGDMGPGSGNALPTVLESKLEHGMENSSNFELNQQNNDKNQESLTNGMLPTIGYGFMPLVQGEELPPLPPPPPPLERSFAIREKLPNRSPPPPPPPPPVPATPPPTTPQNRNLIESPAELDSNQFFSSSVSPVLRRQLWQAGSISMSNHVTAYPYSKSPPPLPIRRPDLPARPYGGQVYIAPTKQNIVELKTTPPPLPPRQSLIDAEVESKNRINAETQKSKANFNNKNKLPVAPTTKKTKSSQSFWKNLTSKNKSNAVSKTKLSSKTSPPPLPPRHSTDVTHLLQQNLKEQPMYEAPPTMDNGEIKSGSPPPPPMGIPPPPAPPPPPAEILPVITKKFEVTCKVKMRPFHWNKVPVLNLKNSVWMDARDLTGKIDTDVLEKNYAAKTSEKQEPDVNKRKLKSFLDPKVAQNLAIFLVGFKMEPEELKYRLTILSEQDGGLTTEHINVLRRYHPTAEDVETYKQFRDTPHELENTDQFMMQLCEIPNLKTRLDLLMIINDFPVAYNDLAPTIDKVSDALDVLCHCTKFVSVLEYVLAVGNYINSGSTKGVAIGFRLTTLPKLSECKSKDKNVTLLKFLVQQIHKSEPGLMDFVDDLIPLTLVPEVSIKALQAESEVMKKDLAKIRRNATTLMKAENPPERDVLFCEEVEAFVEAYDGKLSELSEKSEKVKKLYDQMLVRFGEPCHAESEEIFSAISEFVKAFKREADITLMAAGQTHLVRRKSKLLKKNKKKQNGHTKVDATSSSDSQISKFEKSDTHSVNSTPDIEVKSTHVATLRKAFSDPKSPGSRSGQDFLRERQQTRKFVSNPTKEGWLEKLASTKSPLASQWNKRYFELTNKGQLYYSKKKNEKNVESIYLRGSPIALEDDRTIVIQTEEKVYKLRAPTHQEANDWMQCLLVYTVKPANVPKRAFSQYPSMDAGH